MYSSNNEKKSLDPDDPLLHALRDVFATNATPEQTYGRIFGSATTYKLATLAPWSDVKDEEGAKSVAQETIDVLHAANSKGNRILEPNAGMKSVTISK
jgi:hypothetical protein